MSTFCAKLHRVSRLKLRVRYQHKEPKGRLPKKPSYSVTLSLKVGGGQDEIILLGAAKIVTRWLRWGGLRSLCHHFLCYFWQYFDGQNGIKSGCLNKMPGNVTEKSLKCHKKLFEKPPK